MSEQPTSKYGYRTRQRSLTGEKKKKRTPRRKHKPKKIIPSECGSITEQASETGNPELVQGRATAAKKGEQSVERRQNRPEPTAKKEKKNKLQES